MKLTHCDLVVPYITWILVKLDWGNGLLSDGTNPDSTVHGANMGPTWVLSAPDGPRVGPMNLAIREALPELVTISH